MKRWRTWILFLLITLLSTAGRPCVAQGDGEGIPEPWNVISIKSLDRGRILLRELATEFPWKPLLTLLKRMDKVAALEGVDRTRPFLLLTSADGKELSPPRMLMVIPVTDSLKFVDSCVTRFQVEAIKTSEGRWEIPNKDRKLTAVAIADNVLLMNDETLLPQAALVQKELDEVDPAHDVTVSFRPAGVPTEVQQKLRESVLIPLKNWQRALSEQPGPDSAMLQAMTTFLEEWWARWEGGTRRFDLGVCLDEQWRINGHWLAVPGSKLAKDLTSLRLKSARFARPALHSSSGNAAEVALAIDVPNPVRGLLSLLFSRVWAHASKEIGPLLRAEDLQPADGAFGAIASTISAGRLEAQLSFVPVGNRRFALLGSIGVQKADRIGESLNTVLPYAAQSDKIQEVRMDVISHESLRVHQVLLKEQHKDEVLLYGPDASLYMGMSSHAFLFANGGPATLELMKQVKSEKVDDPDLMRIELRLRPWLALLSQEAPNRRVFADWLKLFPGGDQGDLIELHIQSRPNELRSQLEIDRDLLKVVGRLLFPPALPEKQ